MIGQNAVNPSWSTENIRKCILLSKISSKGKLFFFFFFFKTIFFTDILTRIVAVLFSWVKVKREEKIRPKSTFQIKIANVKEIRESSFLRRIVKHSSLVVSSIVVYYGSKGLKNQSPRIIFQTTFFWKMNLQNRSKIVTKLPACCRKNINKNTEPRRLISWQINCQWNHIFIVN